MTPEETTTVGVEETASPEMVPDLEKEIEPVVPVEETPAEEVKE